MNESRHILLLGSTGTFGQRLAIALARIPQLRLTLASRSITAATMTAHIGKHPNAEVTYVQLDVSTITVEQLATLRPDLVINAAGPFHLQDYALPQACIAAGCHYLDLADHRAYVTNITTLDAAAKAAHCTIITGASTVPALSAAIIDHYLPAFSALESVTYGITPGNQTTRGVGTVAAILSYCGKAFQTIEHGNSKTVHGWQDLQRHNFPALGQRWMSRCDIPDLSLFPARYPTLRSLRFYAGLELSLLHLGLWLLAGMVRLGLPLHLPRYAGLLRQISLWFYAWGSDCGGMHMRLEGRDLQGTPKQIQWYLHAFAGDGPQIPATAALVIVKKWLAGMSLPIGAMPCLGLFTLQEFMAELKDFSITQGAT